MVHCGILSVSATADRVNHLQIQTRSAATLPPAGGRDMCAGGGGAEQVRGRAEARYGCILPRRIWGEELKGKGASWTHNRLVTEVSATEFLLGIEGRVSPVEDKTWPPCRSQDVGQTRVR